MLVFDSPIKCLTSWFLFEVPDTEGLKPTKDTADVQLTFQVQRVALEPRNVCCYLKVSKVYFFDLNCLKIGRYLIASPLDSS